MKQRNMAKQLKNKQRGTFLAACLLVLAVLLVQWFAFPTVAKGENTVGAASVEPSQSFHSAEIGLEFGFLDGRTPSTAMDLAPFSVMRDKGIPQLDVSITEAGLQLFVTLAKPGGRGIGGAAMSSLTRGLASEGASYDRQENGLESDSSDAAAVWENRYPLNFVYRFLVGVKFSIEYNDLNRRDVIAPVGFDVVDFDDEQKALKVSVGHLFENAIFHASMSASQFDERRVNTRDDLEKYHATVYWRPSGQVDRGGYFWADHQDVIMTQERPTQLGFLATYRLSRILSFDTSFEQTGSERNQWIAGLNFTLPTNHLLSLRGRFLHNTDSDLEDSTSIMLTYTIPFGRR